MIRDAHKIAQEMVCYLKASNSRALLPPKSRAAESRGKAARSWQELRPPVEEGGQPPWAQRDRGTETPGPHSPLSLPIAAELPSPNLTRSWGPGIFFQLIQVSLLGHKTRWSGRKGSGRADYGIKHPVLHTRASMIPQYRDRFVPPLPKPSQMSVNPKTTMSRGSKGDTESL